MGFGVPDAPEAIWSSIVCSRIRGPFHQSTHR